jgi:hypothetical protein
VEDALARIRAALARSGLKPLDLKEALEIVKLFKASALAPTLFR